MSAKPSILLVEDDARLAALLTRFLSGEGYDVARAADGDRAVARILEAPPDLVILDINLPGRDGFAVCRAVRYRYPGRILMLTARGDEDDEVTGLRLGADDYLPKPATPRRLLARVEALLRRAPEPAPASSAPAAIRTGDLVIDPGRRVVEHRGAPIEVSTTEFDLLWLLARNLGKVVDRELLSRELRGIPYDGVDRTFDLRISRLRRQLGDDPRRPRLLKTVHGVGYLLARIS